MPQPTTLLLAAFVLLTLLAAAVVAAIKLRLIKPQPDGGKSQPYRRCDRVLSESELKLHTALTAALPILSQKANRQDLPLLFAKVRLSDVLEPDRGKAPERAGPGGWQAARNKINQKHVDFLLCSPTDARPLLVIELDDKTHERPDRRERDDFVDAACRAAALPVLHIPCPPPKVPHNPGQLADQMAKALGL